MFSKTERRQRKVKWRKKITNFETLMQKTIVEINLNFEFLIKCPILEIKWTRSL